MSDKNRSLQKETTDLDRRSLLRTGGVALAGVAGLAVGQTAMAGSAEAATGQPVVMGAANNADATATSLTSSIAGPSLAIANTGAAAQLRLVEAVLPPTDVNLAGGDLANFDGNLYYTAGTTGAPLTGFVYTEYTASQIAPIVPQRVLDTRSAGGRSKIINPAGNLDSAGRLLAGHTITISLSELEFLAVAAYCNLTAVSALVGGFMTLWPGGTRPTTSTVNFGAGAIVANFAVTGVTSTATDETVNIFSLVTTHVLLDITAFAVGSFGQINPTILPAAAAGAGLSTARQHLAARTQAGTLPKWFQAR